MLYIFVVQNNSVNNFYAVLILYGCVGHYHMGLVFSLQAIATFRKTLNVGHHTSARVG